MRKITKDEIVECYIVRIYRRDRKDSCQAMGSVERPGNEVKKLFNNSSELLSRLDFPEGVTAHADHKDRSKKK